ncbi:nudix family hydrolase [Schizosaccharomyces cryophilus OY26]|uniref:Nudix family hydrolase n=1 Tax=Schizosaccharomyces cryophilus (strain OY26 / ATCC MYA-4695 / CBS 11777 / NBRC 106824 / NRRL Y48691) TaxID=653667 RepID=S9VVJ5_SCHCR|nr:nudix family hydrolase [Schizosaccharomyces cryophilus OY26]EPY50189.1 nudix family hydrolase [Schizosaccharomyces cryophilus OY26]
MDFDLDLLTGLQILSQKTPMSVTNGPTKRASVAVILATDPPQKTSSPYWIHQIPSNVVPHVLLIQRSFREKDRWSGHVALPGGIREADDKSDVHTAIRETNEEVGIDLCEQGAYFAGSLDERIVSSNWGSTPLILLSSFVFVLPNLCELHLDEKEVFSAQWIPLTDLLRPKYFTYIKVDPSRAIANQTIPSLQPFLQFFVGKLVYSAIRLEPQIDSPALLLPINKRPLLWGITHSIFVDLFVFFSPSSAKSCIIWTLPYFQHYDLRVITSLISWNYKRRMSSRYPHGNWAITTLNGYYKYLKLTLIIGFLFRITLFCFLLSNLLNMNIATFYK